MEDEIWDELQKQLDAFGLNIENGTMEDATFTYLTSGHDKEDWTKKNSISFLMNIKIPRLTQQDMQDILKGTFLSLMTALAIKVIFRV